MAHQAQHLQLVGNVERLAEAAPVRYRQADETSTGSDLQSGAPFGVSSYVSSFLSFSLPPALAAPRTPCTTRHGATAWQYLTQQTGSTQARDRARQGEARRGKVRQDSHARISELFPVVSQHMPSQHHSRWPRLTSTSRGKVFVDPQWRRKQAAEVQSCVASGLVVREGREVDAHG